MSCWRRTCHWVTVIFCTTENKDYHETAKSNSKISRFHAYKTNGWKGFLDLIINFKNIQINRHEMDNP